MANDPIKEAEQTIAERQRVRAAIQFDYRQPQALEDIADELTRLTAEVRTLRYLFATYASKPHNPSQP